MGLEDNMNTYDLSSNTEIEMGEKHTWEEKIDLGDKEFNEWLEKHVKDPEKFIGVGGAGKVFRLDNQCIKMMINRHNQPGSDKYNLGNTAQKEANIQAHLSDLVVDGVYCPKVVGFYEGEKNCAIVMEELDAVNMQLVLNGKEELPKGFDNDIFFERLEDYLSEMHERGVVHKDLDPRNIMIDINTGLPRVIDFGRADIDTEKSEGFEMRCLKDFDKVDAALEKMEEFIDKR